MPKTRFLYKDAQDKGSTTGWVVEAFNAINQRRQFATDMVRVFYQPKKDDRTPFIPVNEADLPPNAREALARERGITLDEWNEHWRLEALRRAPKRWMRVECVVQFPSPIGSDEAFDQWMRALDKVVTVDGVHPRSSKLLEVRSTDPDEDDPDRQTTAKAMADTLDALIDGQEGDGLGEVLAPIRDYLRRL